MNNNKILKKLEEYGEYKRMLNEIKDCMTALESEIKDFVGETEETIVNGIKIVNKAYTQNRFDSTRFKKEHSDIYNDYLKQINCKKFSVKF